MSMSWGPDGSGTDLSLATGGALSSSTQFPSICIDNCDPSVDIYAQNVTYTQMASTVRRAISWARQRGTITPKVAEYEADFAQIEAAYSAWMAGRGTPGTLDRLVIQLGAIVEALRAEGLISGPTENPSSLVPDTLMITGDRPATATPAAPAPGGFPWLLVAAGVAVAYLVLRA